MAPSGDHYIKHMYYYAFAKENAAYTIAAMAPCPYVYQVIANRRLQDPELNTDSILKNGLTFTVLKWMNWLKSLMI